MSDRPSLDEMRIWISLLTEDERRVVLEMLLEPTQPDPGVPSRVVLEAVRAYLGGDEHARREATMEPFGATICRTWDEGDRAHALTLLRDADRLLALANQRRQYTQSRPALLPQGDPFQTLTTSF